MLRGSAAQRAAQHIVDYITDWLRYDGVNEPGKTRVTVRAKAFDWEFTVWRHGAAFASVMLGDTLGKASTAPALLTNVRTIRDTLNQREGLRWPRL